MITWNQLSKIKKKTAKLNKNVKFPKFGNNLGYDETLRLKQEEYAVWFRGKSDELLQFYREVAPAMGSDIEEFRNSKDYFWAIVGREDDVKCTHSSLPNTMINTLVNILGRPTITAVKDVATEEGKIVEEEDIAINNRIQEMIDDNDFYRILKEDQTPYMMVIGDGAYFINIDTNTSDLPIIEYIDGRNIDFEIKSNRIVAVTARKYYVEGDKGYLLTDRRSTKLTVDDHSKKKRVATVEYKLFELTDADSEEAKTEVELTTLKETSELKNLIFQDFDEMLAVPCVYQMNKDVGRGESLFGPKLDLFDDLDQSKSMTSHITRVSAPVDYLPEELIDHDRDGNPIPPSKFDRKYMVTKANRNAVGQNIVKVETTQPELHFDKYNTHELEIVMDILSGIMSPATLGIDLSRKDNATAQREKEKVTLITRDDLVDIQTPILKKLFTLALKIYDYMTNPKSKPGNYKITVNYPEYANPSFENKLAYLTPAYAAGGMSEEKYVDELWEDALNEEEKKHEIETLRQRKSQQVPSGALDNVMLE